MILGGFIYYLIHIVMSYVSVYLQWYILRFVFGEDAPIGAMISVHQTLTFVVFAVTAHMFEGGPFKSLKWIRFSASWAITCWIIFGIWSGSVVYRPTTN